MPRINDPENFAGRVNYAASIISNGAHTSRGFDSCFENYDGDEVAVALYRRSLNNPKLAANLWRYLGNDSVMDAVTRLADVTNLAAHARTTRARCVAEFDVWLAKNQRA